MRINKIDENKCTINIEIPLTSHSGKIRIKERRSYTDFGTPVATRQKILNQNMYVEWQISYDIELSNKEIKNLSYFYREYKNFNSTPKFKSYNGKQKTLYELSEYVYFFYKMNIISKTELEALINYIKNVKEFIEDKFSIMKSYPKEEKINNIKFLSSEIRYPHLIYDFENGFLVIAEITIKEKQRAIGIQPMMYICFPISCLVDKDGNKIMGRKAYEKEVSFLEINKNHKDILISTLKIFSFLSKNHRHDILEILQLIYSL